MAYILSEEQLRKVRNDVRFFSNLNESRVARTRSAYSREITVFLSHNHRDKEILESVIVELKLLGVNI